MFIYDNTVVIDGSLPVPLFYCPRLYDDVALSSKATLNKWILARILRHGSQIRPQLSAAGPTNRPQPKVIVTIVIIKPTSHRL